MVSPTKSPASAPSTSQLKANLKVLGYASQQLHQYHLLSIQHHPKPYAPQVKLPPNATSPLPRVSHHHKLQKYPPATPPHCSRSANLLAFHQSFPAQQNHQHPLSPPLQSHRTNSQLPKFSYLYKLYHIFLFLSKIFTKCLCKITIKTGSLARKASGAINQVYELRKINISFLLCHRNKSETSQKRRCGKYIPPTKNKVTWGHDALPTIFPHSLTRFSR